jgi:AraC-like DNA-binding protein
MDSNRFHRAPPQSTALAPFVEALWYFEGEFPHTRERMLPSGTMQLLVNLHEDELRSYHGDACDRLERTRGAHLSGAYGHPFGIDTAEQRAILGVSFRPGGAYPFFRAPASATCELGVELDLLWGREGALLRERLLEQKSIAAKLQLLEAILLAQVTRTLAPDPTLAFAIAALEHGRTVADVVTRLGLTPKRFMRRFSEQVGLTPKRYARVRRFHRLLRALPLGADIDWAALACAHGYFDQAHLIHDFRRFAGTTPGAYRPRTEAEREHVPLPD